MNGGIKRTWDRRPSTLNGRIFNGKGITMKNLAIAISKWCNSVQFNQLICLPCNSIDKKQPSQMHQNRTTRTTHESTGFLIFLFNLSVQNVMINLCKSKFSAVLIFHNVCACVCTTKLTQEVITFCESFFTSSSLSSFDMMISDKYNTHIIFF